MNFMVKQIWQYNIKVAVCQVFLKNILIFSHKSGIITLQHNWNYVVSNLHSVA